MTTSLIQVTSPWDGIVTITLNRPEKKCAFYSAATGVNVRTL
ncbi:MAG: hypothetical protein SVZ03_01455 [Spirochaetota bacterium]|nr:hypothetical protein [Spirochaetota bacterium]